MLEHDRAAASETDDTDLTWRGLSAASDLDAWFALIDRIQRHDRCHERVHRRDLDVLPRQSWVDLEADARVLVDADDVMRAYGHNSFRPAAGDDVSVLLLGGVDPDWRGRGIGRRVLAWQRERATQNVADLRAASSTQLPGRIGCGVEEQVTSRARLLESAGFTATRWFTELRRPLAGPYVVPPLPVDGLRVEPYADAHAERLRVAHNEAFRDHWGTNPHDAESWRTNVLENEAFRPRQSFVVVDPATPGEPIVAYVVNTEYEQDWADQSFTDGYTEMLGVRRGWRGRGLARRLLTLTARVFAEAGHRYATLDVDADNPTGAVALYESLGYEPVHRAAYYSVAV